MEQVISLREAFARLPDTKTPYAYPMEGMLTLICLARSDRMLVMHDPFDLYPVQ